MKHRLVAVMLTAMAGAQAAEEYSFDAAEFEKKPYELGGYVEIRQDHLSLNRDSAFYRLAFYNQEQREHLDRTTGNLQLAGKLRHGAATFDLRTSSVLQRDQLGEDHESKIFEAAVSVRASPGLTFDAGKRTLRWGKGYAWNPIGFVERPKDPNDPQLAREGFVMANADWISSP
ncbi:MAG TPA: hypothetical protein VFZ74_13330, partial [Burkholderiales bacterium]